MNSSAGFRILHLVPPNGGGVDRFVRDLCRRRTADWLVHVSEDQWVVEIPDQDLMIPVAFDALDDLAERGGFGRAAALHVHSTAPAVRVATGLLASAMQLRYVLTLHDVEFTGAAEPAERRAQRLAFVRAAASCTVPSHFMRDLALKVMGDNFACTVVENGVDRHASTSLAAPTQRFPVAVIGAMGKHKGLDQLIEVADRLPAGERIVLLGYADGQLSPGWLGDGRVYVHGAFEPAQLPDLVANYGSRLAFFPKGQPESYCYALSDAWLAGLPVVAPDSGAIGERVRAHGGGTLYDPDAPATDVALAISHRLSETGASPSGIQGAVQSLTSIATMVESMNNIYSGIAAPESAPDLEELKRSAANHLDGRFFRRELLRLQGDLVAVGEQRDNALRELQALGQNFSERGKWIDQLQLGQEELRRAIRAFQQERDELQQVRRDSERLQQALDHLRSEQAQLQEMHRELVAAHAALIRRLSLPLRVLPLSWQTWVRRIVKRILVSEKSK